MRRIVFVNRFYWPETPATGQLLTDLASDLAAAGHAVTVITSRPNDAAVPRGESHCGVDIIRIRSPRWAHVTIVGNAIAFIAFTAGAAWRLWRHTRRGDLIIAMTDPPLLGIFAAMIAELRGARLVHWLQDIYPDVAVALTGHQWLRAMTPTRNSAWRTADQCVVLSAEMAALVVAAGVPRSCVHLVPNWPPVELRPTSPHDADVLALRREWHLESEFVIAYSGNLGRVHDLGPVIAAAATLAGDPRFVFALIGTGAQLATIKEEVRHRGLTNVRFFPPQPREQLGITLAIADVHLVTLRPGCEQFVFPSKLYGIAAVGRPVVFIGPPGCELAQLVVTHQLGYAVGPDNAPAIASAIRKLANDASQCARFAAGAVRFGNAHRTDLAMHRWRRLIDGLEAC